MQFGQTFEHLGLALLIIALALLALVLVHLLSKRLIRVIDSLERVSEERQQQLITLFHASRWVINTVIFFTAFMMLLSTLGVNITPLLASAGVAGLAISLGAQTLIKDLIGGMLILIENQYGIGDIIEVGSAKGEVERITLRTTLLRGASGELYVVPNGEVRILANQTKDWSRALVDVGVAYEADLARAIHILEEGAREFGQDPEMAPYLMEPPQVVGPLSLGDWAITVRVVVKTQPGKHLEVARRLRGFILALCEREGIELPYPRQEVLVRDKGPFAE